MIPLGVSARHSGSSARLLNITRNYLESMMTDLASEALDTSQSAASQLPTEHVSALLRGLPGWLLKKVDGVERIEKVYSFKDFSQALAFTNQVGALAEQEDHHPALLTEWGQVTVGWWSHSLGGLHRNDLIMAARTDQLA
ncbi:4a-hydroxytetrahydrobiopterin dehydratase [Halopseudomonas sabulinigri]|uniref:Putative pterin-4-alpha-carbinolamine dehydratase n=2 Tax=Halopseudomonas sabulinigri TaxID=472181 RepID=A0A1H1L2D7_9GAMM|nr:4a-hydroxytetrahydrobiopterin dehydratase [Halopseudomonas sabulinigri]